jgi:hypothetical protein
MSSVKPGVQSAGSGKIRCPRLLDIQVTENEIETNLVDSKKTIQRLLTAEILHVPVGAVSPGLHPLLNIDGRSGSR